MFENYPKCLIRCQVLQLFQMRLFWQIFKHCAKMSGSHKHVRRDKEMIIELLCLFVYLDRKLVNLESPSVLYIVVGDVWSPQL